MIPAWLTDKLSHPPEAGAGIHGWLFSVARQLHAHMPAEAIEAALIAATANCTRRVTGREIRDAVRNSVAVAWVPKDEQLLPQHSAASVKTAQPRERWPKQCAVTRRMRIKDAVSDGIAGLEDLWEASPVQPTATATAAEWLSILFPNAEWLCLAGDHPATARTRKPHKWHATAAECGLIVPSPMTGPSGKGLDGRTSHRCLGNTGARLWLVIEFDSGELNEQAALHWHLKTEGVANQWPELRLCVHSGKKSLHGWYGPVSSEAAAHDLMSYAVSLGADPATWNRCQLVRLPGGRRKVSKAADLWSEAADNVPLEVFYFNSCPNLNTHSLAPGAPSDSMQPRDQMAA